MGMRYSQGIQRLTDESTSEAARLRVREWMALGRWLRARKTWAALLEPLALSQCQAPG